jgi:superfamily II DNA/RNA helicase
MTPGFGAGLIIPDLWQQEAVRALQQGKDVVVQASTGSGKTYINLHQRRVTSDE